MFNAIQQFFASFHGAKLSTLLLLTLAAGAVLLLDWSAGDFLEAAATWAPALAVVAFFVLLALSIARIVQTLIAASEKREASGLRFTKISAQITQQMPPLMPANSPATPPTFSIVVGCICSIADGNAKIVDGRILAPKWTFATPVQVVATQLGTAGADMTPRIHAREVWELTITANISPERPFALKRGETIAVRVALIDELARSHVVAAAAYIN